MSLFVLTDESESYWWLKHGGFSLITYGFQPLAFPLREDAERKANELKQLYGFNAHPLIICAPHEKRRRK